MYYIFRKLNIYNVSFVKYRYNPNRGGLYSWCDEHAVKFSDEENKWYDEGIYDKAVDVICHAEFYKLVQWHSKFLLITFYQYDHNKIISRLRFRDNRPYEPSL